ncbi:MAG: FUN14 domain-containing protein [Candidatus Nezhaarchaeales archaeon]
MDPSTLALQAVGGFVVGSLIGYAVRKLAKWTLLAIGFMLLPIFGLWQIGVLDVNWEGLNAAIARFVEWLGVNISDMSLAIASTGVLGASGLFGFVFGLTGGFRHTIFPEPMRQFRFVKRKSRIKES